VKIKVENKPRIEKILRPFQRFFRTQASGGIVLLICAVTAIVWANSPWSEYYEKIWHTDFTIGIKNFFLTKSLHFWINDGLMAIFFFVVGLEIKRELIIGELSSFKKASLPIAAAIGGMFVPAAIYSIFNYGSDSISGWGIPMATDIAFAVGIIALFGDRIPLALKVFLTALAIVDDLGAVLVIAIFYTSDLNITALVIGGIILVTLMICNRLHIRHPIVYLILGIGLWFALLMSGVHATIAGVAAAFTIPAKARINSKKYVDTGKNVLEKLEASENIGEDVPTTKEFNSAVFHLESISIKVLSPMHRLEHKLTSWVAFFVMPVFALVNAGSWLFIKMKIAVLPSSVNWNQLYGVSAVAGIGFTMSLFIAGLAFDNILYLQEAKLGILIASTLAGIFGAIILKTGKKPKPNTK
jgi:NhaA family Na+:H+ antiporter